MKKKDMRDIIINLMDDFVTTIVSFATQVSSSPFFEFVRDFIISYKKNIGPWIVDLLKCMTTWVILEMQHQGGKADKNFNINRSWNVIWQIFDMREFIPAYVHEME